MITLRLGADGTPNPSGLTYWDVDTTVSPPFQDRTWYTVLHDGWLVAEVYVNPCGWRVASKPREPIPAAVLAEIPTEGRALLIKHTGEAAAVVREHTTT